MDELTQLPHMLTLTEHRLIAMRTVAVLSVAGCAAPPPDAHRFCLDSRGLTCQRELLSGRIDEPQFRECYDSIVLYCDGRRSWACDPPPTSVAVEECVTALQDEARLSVPAADIAECSNLCPSGGV